MCDVERTWFRGLGDGSLVALGAVMKQFLLALTASLFPLTACVLDDDLDTVDEVSETDSGLSAFAQSIQSRASGKCLDIPNGSFASGAPVNQFTCHGGPAQQFAVDVVPLGYVRIRNTRSNLCVAPTGYAGWSTPSMRLVQSACSGPYVQWNRVNVVALAGGTRSTFQWGYDGAYCIDVPSGSTADSLQLQAYPCHGGLNQSFEQRP